MKMETWRNALDSFLSPWKKRADVCGALVCGSFVTGEATPLSDIDLHIVLKPNEHWRKRGNKRVQGYLVEYFVNPPAQIRRYFEEDYKENSWSAMIQFVTGEMLFDFDQEVAHLQQDAKTWIERPFKRIPEEKKGLSCYGLWDAFDNLSDGADRKADDLPYMYFHFVSRVFDAYARFLGWHVTSIHQHYRLILDNRFRGKYQIPPFPDEAFIDLFKEAVAEIRLDKMIPVAESLFRYVTDSMGGFEIDGWSYTEKIKTNKRSSTDGIVG